MNLEDVKKFIQNQFTDGLVIVVGSGLSLAEGIAGMGVLADHLMAQASGLSTPELVSGWAPVANALSKGGGLEEALLAHPPIEELELWISAQTCDLLLPQENTVIREVVSGGRELPLTKLLKVILQPQNGGIPIITTNYDRLVEVACERAGFHVDTTAIGIYGGDFDHKRSAFMSCRGIAQRGKTTTLDYAPRAIVLKPHGSFDWYLNGDKMIRCSIELNSARGIITPGFNKYRAGYATPFDIHRELANQYIRDAARFVIIGYGFNDDHLQTHLLKKINDGTPTLIITRTITSKVRDLAINSPLCICVGKPSIDPGVALVTKGTEAEYPGSPFWNLTTLVQEVLQ